MGVTNVCVFWVVRILIGGFYFIFKPLKVSTSLPNRVFFFFFFFFQFCDLAKLAIIHKRNLPTLQVREESQTFFKILLYFGNSLEPII
jgi:hypothetical protein